MTKANYGVECSRCGEPIALLEDVGDAVVNIPRPGRLSLKCRGCGHRGHYSTDHVQRYEVFVEPFASAASG